MLVRSIAPEGVMTLLVKLSFMFFHRKAWMTLLVKLHKGKMRQKRGRNN